MTFCEECGKQLPEGANKCPNCGAPVNNEHIISNESVSPNETVQHNSYTTPQEQPHQSYPAHNSYPQPNYYSSYRNDKDAENLYGLILGEGEKIVRQYQCSYIQGFLHWIKMFNCKGFLTVTNQRIIFQGKGPISRISNEISLNSVSGLDSYIGFNINLFGIIIGLLLIILSMWGFDIMSAARRFSMSGSSSSGSTLLLLFILAIGVLLIINSIQKSFLFKIFSSRAGSAPITLGIGALTSLGNGALKTLSSAPTSDTEPMLNELGALVHDLQTMGDAAIEKWNKQR